MRIVDTREHQKENPGSIRCSQCGSQEISAVFTRSRIYHLFFNSESGEVKFAVSPEWDLIEIDAVQCSNCLHQVILEDGIVASINLSSNDRQAAERMAEKLKEVFPEGTF